jgi:phospholipase C
VSTGPPPKGSRPVRRKSVYEVQSHTARAFFAAFAAAFLTASCAGGTGSTTGSASLPLTHGLRSATGSGVIQHVVIMVQENRSFNNLFATFPGANGTTKGHMSGRGPIKLMESNLLEPCDFGHSYMGFRKDYNHGKMNGFNTEGGGNAKKGCPPQAGTLPYQYVNPVQIAPYWDIAQQYVLADNMFQTQGSGSFTAHQDLIRGGTMIDSGQTQSLVDFPTDGAAHPWGCDAPSGTTTPLLVWTGTKVDEKRPGPFPCTTSFPGSGSYYATMRDLLDAKSVSWKYYTPSLGSTGGLWNAFDVIAPVRYGSEWTTNVISPETQILSDISGGTLPAVSWLIPKNTNSDHPGVSQDNGPSWVASVVNAIGTSQYWPTTAIIITWDDWGGFYDQVSPPLPFDHWGGLGFRVPMLIVSPYARMTSPTRPGYISHTQYEFGSILRFVEDVWSLGQLGTTDVRANSIGDSFDFTQPPRTFQMIPASHTGAYFERQAPSNEPIDSE